MLYYVVKAMLSMKNRLQQNEAMIKVFFNGKKTADVNKKGRLNHLLFIAARGTLLVP